MGLISELNLEWKFFIIFFCWKLVGKFLDMQWNV